MTDIEVRSHELVGDWATNRNLRIVRTADRLIANREVALCRDGVADVKMVRSLTKWILAAADLVQERICGTINHQSLSHRTCIDAVEAALYAHPVPWGAAADVKGKWLDELADRAAELVDVAAGLEEQHRDARRRGEL